MMRCWWDLHWPRPPIGLDDPAPAPFFQKISKKIFFDNFFEKNIFPKYFWKKYFSKIFLKKNIFPKYFWKKYFSDKFFKNLNIEYLNIFGKKSQHRNFLNFFLGWCTNVLKRIIIYIHIMINCLVALVSRWPSLSLSGLFL